jgi:DNA repair protein RadC
VVEFILRPGAITSNTYGFFSNSRLGYNSTLQVSIHLHPSGNPNPSLVDINNLFKTKNSILLLLIHII